MRIGIGVLTATLIVSLFLTDDSFCGVKNNFFMFSTPSVGNGAYSVDPNVFYRCQYYGYFNGIEPSSFEYSTGFGTSANRALFAAASDTGDFWAAVEESISDYATWMENNRSLFTSANQMDQLCKKIHVAHNADFLFDKIADSLVCFQADTFALSIEMMSKFIVKTDSIVRTWYPDCDTVIHQIAQEINYHYREPGTMYDQRHNWIEMFTGGDTTAAYQMWMGVLDSIAAMVKISVPNTSKTAVDWHFLRDPDAGSIPDNSDIFKETAFDSLTNIDIFFLTIDGRRPQYYFIEINNVPTTYSLGNRKVGLRYSWGDILAFGGVQSFEHQLKTFQDIESLIPNAEYLTLWHGAALDGKIGSESINVSEHFRALAFWLGKKYLHLIDHFSWGTGVFTYLWDEYGTVYRSVSDSTALIGQNEYLRSKITIDEGGTAVGHYARNSEGSSGGKQHSQILHLSDDADQYISLFTRNDTLVAEVKQGAITRSYPFANQIVNNSNQHEYKINWDSDNAKFYFDGSLKQTIDSLAGDFDEDIKLKYATANVAGISDMILDSTRAIANDTLFPSIEITNFGVDTTIYGGDYWARAWMVFTCEAEADVEVWLQQLNWPYATAVTNEWYSHTISSTTGDSCWWWQHGYTAEWYRLKLVTSKDGVEDSVFSHCWYFDADSCILASANDEVVASTPSLPKSFSLAQNSPNPFNPSTSIQYEIPPEINAVPVRLEIYGLRGQKVSVLVDHTSQPAGTYTVHWDGKDSYGRPVSSGVYFYRLKAGDFVATRKMVLLK